MPTPTRPEKRRRITLPTAAAATIPDDLLISEVFVRLPVESLMRVKSVCRAWRAAVEDPDFVRRHLALSRARPPSLLVIGARDDLYDDASKYDKASFHRLVLDEARTVDVVPMFEKALPDTLAVLPTHCDGLVALTTAAGQVSVCNPATREFVTLPPGSRDVRRINARVNVVAAALCYDSWRDRYVVARYFYRKYGKFDKSGRRRDDIGHEIFTLGDDGTNSSAWVATADPPRDIGPVSPVCTRDVVYWRTSLCDWPGTLLRFGLRDRAFDVVPCPPGTEFTFGESVTELAGKLCYVHHNTETAAYDVWVADDGSRPQWSLRCRVDLDLFGRLGLVKEYLLPVSAAGDEIIIAEVNKQLYSYDVRRKSVKQVVDLEEELAFERHDGTPCCYLRFHVVPYVESLVSISARRS